MNIIYHPNIIVNVTICIFLSSSIKEIDYLDHLQYNIIKIITGSSNLKETTYLDYIQYIIIYIIVSDNDIKEIDYSDYIQLYIIIVIYFNTVTDPNYLRNIKTFVIMTIVSCSNMSNISIQFNIIDYIINTLLITIQNIDTNVCYVKIISIIHINYKHHIDIENVKTINTINYSKINKTVNNIYLYIINIINSHTIIDTIHIQYNITFHILYVIIMTVELYQSIIYTLTNFHGFIIIVETGHPIGDVNLILYINAKKTSYVIKPALHHRDQHRRYIQNIDDIKGMHHCILEDALETSKMHQQHPSYIVSIDGIS